MTVAPDMLRTTPSETVRRRVPTLRAGLDSLLDA